MATQPEVKADAGYGPEPQLTVDRPALHADPGGSATTPVTVRHGGNRVEGFALDVVGLPPAWWRVEPPLLELLPGTSGTAVVEFRPPPGTPAPDAPLPFGVRATSALDATRAVVEEGDLEVGRQLSLTAEIAPLTSRGRWRGRHVVTFTNWGNAAIDLALSGRDRDGRLAFLFAPASLKVPIGGTANSRVKARVRRPVLRGKREQIPFQVVATGPGGTPVPGAPGAPAMPGVPGAPGVPAFPGAPVDPGARTLDAVVEQRPVLSNGVLLVLGLVALLVVALVAWLVRSPAPTGARQPTVRPPVPTGVQLTGFAGGRATLAWKKNDYASHRVDVFAGQPEQGVDPVLSVPVVPYRFSAVVVVKGAKPSTLYCFQVLAVDGDSVSTAAKAVCATTKPAPLAAPTMQDLAPAPGGLLVSWNGQPGTTYEVAGTTPEGAPDGAAPKIVKGSQVVVPVQAGFPCFVVTATKGGQRSTPSDPPKCRKVEPKQVNDPNGGPPGGGPGGSPGTSPSPSLSSSGGAVSSPPPSTSRIRSGWLVPFDYQQDDGANTQDKRAREDQAVAALKAAGYKEAGYLLFDPKDYPVFHERFFIAYALVAPDEATATKACDDIRKTKERKDSPFAAFAGCDTPVQVPGQAS